jgi:hypothetical protein
MNRSADVLLVRLEWPGDEMIACLRALGERWPALGLFSAVDRHLGYAYLDAPVGASTEAAASAIRAIVPQAVITRLELLSEVAGASIDDAAPYRYVVETDVQPATEDDFNAWYEREHLPGLAAVEGTVRARRYRDRDGHPRYHACYDLARTEAVGCPAWLAVRGTAWSSRVRPAFFNTRRTMLARV